MNQISLRPGDIAIAFAIGMLPKASIATLASATQRSAGEVHNGIRRLSAGLLLKPGERELVIEPFLRFLRWGLPVAFPARVGGVTRGVATARAIPVERAGEAGPTESNQVEFVWPEPVGPARGQALTPLYPAAPLAAQQNATFHRLLALGDLMRVGGVREQDLALELIAKMLRKPAA